MKTKILIIAVVVKDDSILMRKKPDGSLPYKETWYLFGAELESGKTIEDSIKDELLNKTGVKIELDKQLSWDTEVKKDLDGEVKQFVYLDVLCSFVFGDLKIGDEAIEKLEELNEEEMEKTLDKDKFFRYLQALGVKKMEKWAGRCLR